MRLTRDLNQRDLESLLALFLPLHIRLAGERKRHLVIGDARSVALVPNEGVRLETTAHIHWERLGIGIPITVRSVTALVRPHIGPGGRTLVFVIHIDQADLVGLPGFIDQTIVDKANEALANAGMAWDFGKTLKVGLPLPVTMTPVSRVDLSTTGGEVIVTAEGLLLTVDVGAGVPRERLVADNDKAPLTLDSGSVQLG